MQPIPAKFALAVLTCSSVMMMGCGQDQDRAKQPRVLAPQQAAQNLHDSPQLDSIESDVRGPNGDVARVRCATCHSMLKTDELPDSPQQLEQFHRGLQVTHGSLSCASCHRSDKPDSLHLATGKSLEMDEAMTLCSQCHGPQRKSYDHGAHGGMTGHWDRSRGERTRNQCVDCHDPHTPQIPHVMPVLPPIDRGLPAPHEESHPQEKGHP